MNQSIDLSLYPEGAALDRDGHLLIGGCRIGDLATKFGTPAYIIDEGALRRRARQYIHAFTSLHANTQILFASKSFPSASVVGVLAEEGCGIDVAAEGELFIALKSGAAANKMVLHGNAKSDSDIQAAIAAGIGYIVIDNHDDIDRIVRFSHSPVQALLRVSPAVAAATHKSMATGHDKSKFGIPSMQIEETIARIRREPMIDLRGLHVHIGSQILALEQFEAAIAALGRLERFPVYNFGGGLGVRYVSADISPAVETYAERMVTAVHEHLGTDIKMMLEPGRSMIARNGITLYRVLTVKHGLRTHVAVDGGMGDNLEVSLYGQPFQPSILNKSGGPVLCDVVGRHCESGDTLATQVPLIDPRVGDLLAVPVTGAYCFTMANNYNGALKPPVVFCRDGTARLAVRRQTPESLIEREMLLP